MSDGFVFLGIGGRVTNQIMVEVTAVVNRHIFFAGMISFVAIV